MTPKSITLKQQQTEEEVKVVPPIDMIIAPPKNNPKPKKNPTDTSKDPE